MVQHIKRPTRVAAEADRDKMAESSAMAAAKAAGQVGSSEDPLMASLERHDASFSALLSLIPSDMYLPAESNSDIASEEVLGKKGGAKQSKREKRLALEDNNEYGKLNKRAKLDAQNANSRTEASHRTKSDAALAPFKPTGGDRAGDTDSDIETEEDDEDDRSSYETLPTSNNSAKGSEEGQNDKPSLDSPLSKPESLGIQDLRARLQAKIQGMRAERGLQGRAGSDASLDDESTASTRDELLEERRKRRGEMRDRRRKAAKERKKAEREGVNASAKKGASNAAGVISASSSRGNTSKGQDIGKGKARADASSSSKNDGLTFSALEFDDDHADRKKKSKHALPSDPKAALAILEARKRRVDFADKEKAESSQWSKAEAAAQGVRIRDDEALLRKSIKKREKQKAKSGKEWKQRQKDITSQQQARQKKRQDNIAARKDKKGGGGGGDKKKVRSSGGNKARAGFEGKRRPLIRSGRPGGKK